MLPEFFVYPIHFESKAFLTICIFASGQAFLHHRKVMACFYECYKGLRAIGMARHVFTTLLVANMGLLHSFTKRAMVMMLIILVMLAMMAPFVVAMMVPFVVAMMVPMMVPFVVAMMVPFVLAVMVPLVVAMMVEHGGALVVACVIARLAGLVACVHLLQCRAFFFSQLRGAIWVCVEHFVHPIHFELGAHITFCSLTRRAAFFDGR